MVCKYCNEKDESKIVMRSTVVDGRVETENICTSCLWEQLLNDHSEDGNLLSKQASPERTLSAKSKSAHSAVGKKPS